MNYDVEYTPKQKRVFQIEKSVKEMLGMISCVVTQIPTQYKKDEHHDDLAEMLKIFQKFDDKFRELHRKNFILDMAIKSDDPNPENIERKEEKCNTIVSELTEMMDDVCQAYMKAYSLVDEYTKKRYENVRADILREELK